MRDEEPAPTSAEEISSPIGVAFPEQAPTRTPLFPEIKQSLERFPVFISDAELDLNFRSYYFLRDIDGGLASDLGIPEKAEAWAGGGSIALRSGWLWNHLAVGGEFFTSAPIRARDDRRGTGLLKPTQDPIAVVGQAYAQLKYEQQVVTLYRQKYDKPYLNSNDSRMIPNTFEGYSIDGHWRHGRFLAGYVTRIKPRAHDRFIPMSRAAGVRDKDRGLAMLGVRFEVDGFWLGTIASVVPDLLSTIYTEVDKTWSVGEWGIRVGAQFTDQRSVGDELLSAGHFDTQSGGMRIAVSFRHAVLTTAFNVTSDGAPIRSFYGGDPSFSGLMLSDFTLANQKAIKIGLSYDYGRIGLAGLSGFVNYTHGFDAEFAATGASIRDADEIDLTLDIRPERPLLRGAWLRVRAGVLNPGADRRRVVQARAIFNWALQLL